MKFGCGIAENIVEKELSIFFFQFHTIFHKPSPSLLTT